MLARLSCGVLLSLLAVQILPAQGSLTATPSSLEFYYQAGGTTPPQQNIQITGTANYVVTISPSVTAGTPNWLFPVSSGSTVPFQLGVLVGPGSLGVGTYTGNIRLSVPDSTVPPLDIPIKLTISTQPLLTPNPTSLRFVKTSGGAEPASQVINLGATSAVTFSAAAETITGGSWLNVTPLAGNTPGQLTVTAQAGNLAIGTYTGNIVVASAQAANGTIRIPVTLNVTAEVRLSALPSTLQFDYQIGDTKIADQGINIATTGANVPWTAAVATQSGGNWLTISATAGTSPSYLIVHTEPASLPAGTYQGTVTINASGATNNPQIVTVTLRVASTPLIRSLPTSLNFTYEINGSAVPPQTVLIYNSGAALATTLTASVTGSGSNWLSVTPGTSQTPTAAVATINPAGLTAGTYTGSITVTGNGAANTLSIPVTLQVSGSPLLRTSPNQLTFYYQIGQAAPGAKKISVGSTSSATNITANGGTYTGGPWLNVTPATGGTPSDVTVTVNPAGMPAGLYNGFVSVQTSTGASQILTPVRLIVDTAPMLDISQAALEFSWSIGGALPTNQGFTVASTGGVVPFTINNTTSTGGNWLIVAPDNGNTPLGVNVGVSALSLGQGTFTGVLQVNAAGAANSPQYVPVVLRINQNVELVVPSDELLFTQTVGGTAPGAKQLTIKSNPALPIRYDVTSQVFDGSGWLSISPNSGLTESTISVAVNTTNLQPGTYRGEVAIASSGANNSPRRVPVRLVISRPLPNLNLSTPTAAFTYTGTGAAPQPQSVQVTSSGDPVTFGVTTATNSGGSWLFVSSSSATTPASIAITTNPAGLAVGTYAGTVTISSTGAANSPLTINVSLTVGTSTAPVVTSVTNGASYQPSVIAPGLVVVLKGTGLGPAQLAGLVLTPQGLVDTTIAGTRVLFDNVPAPMIYAWTNQTAAVVPYDIAGRATVQMVVEVQGVRSQAIQLRVVDTAPGIFTADSSGSGGAAALNQNGTLNTPQNPAQKGSVVVFYATGEGMTTPPGVNGQVTGSTLKRPLGTVRVRFAGQDVPVDYAGSAPGIVSGVMQVNVRVPTDPNIAALITGSAIPVELIVGGNSSVQNVTIAIQ